MTKQLNLRLDPAAQARIARLGARWYPARQKRDAATMRAAVYLAELVLAGVELAEAERRAIEAGARGEDGEG